MTMRFFLANFTILLVAAASTVGCQTIRYPRGLLEQQKGKAAMSSRELRIILDDLVLQYCSRVEQGADQIIATTSDTRIRKNALQWKSNGIAACFQAASRSDPLGAYLDIWILNKQSLELFERPSRPSLFGDSQGVAIETSQQLEQSMQAILAMIGNDFPIGEEFASNFARDYPIQNLYFNRESIAAHYTNYIEKIQVADRELMDVVGDLDNQLDQLNKISSMYAEFLPKQARWQGQIMILETLESESVSGTLVDASVAADGVARIADTTETVPELIERERSYLHRAVSEERVATIQAIDQMREETVVQLRQERIAVMSGLQDERDAVLHAVQQERLAATDDLTEFGSQTIQHIDASVDAKLDEIAGHSVRLADHVFKRIAQLCLAIGAALMVALIAMRPKRKKRSTLKIHSIESASEAATKQATYLDEHRRNAA